MWMKIRTLWERARHVLSLEPAVRPDYGDGNPRVPRLAPMQNMSVEVIRSCSHNEDVWLKTTFLKKYVWVCYCHIESQYVFLRKELSYPAIKLGFWTSVSLIFTLNRSVGLMVYILSQVVFCFGYYLSPWTHIPAVYLLLQHWICSAWDIKKKP